MLFVRGELRPPEPAPRLRRRRIDAPAFGVRRACSRFFAGAKGPASRTHSKRFASCLGLWWTPRFVERENLRDLDANRGDEPAGARTAMSARIGTQAGFTQTRLSALRFMEGQWFEVWIACINRLRPRECDAVIMIPFSFPSKQISFPPEGGTPNPDSQTRS